MQHSRLISVAFASLGIGVFVGATGSRGAVVQLGGAVPSFIKLQSTTPGSPQAGHSNITGTALAAQFQGSGATMSGSKSADAVLLGSNSSASVDSAGSKGVSTAVSGTTYGLWGVNSSSSGRGVFGEATATTGLNYGGRFESAGSTGRGVYGIATGNGATFGVYGVSESPTGRGVRGSATGTTGTNYGGYFDSAGTTGYGVFATSAGTYGLSATSTLSAGSSYGVYGETQSTNGRGVAGFANAASGSNYGVFGQSTSTSGRGVYGIAEAVSGSAYGVFGESQSTSGRGVLGLANATSGTTYGGYFDSDSTSGYGVYASSAGPYGVYGLSTLASADANGVYGRSTGPDGRGVFGIATAATGVTMGVRGEALSDDGTGVWGEANFNEGTGVFGFGYEGVYAVGRTIGVKGIATGQNGGIGVQGSTTVADGIGVLGFEDGTNPDYGVYAGGDLGASGSKSFRIDHPRDPANKYLLHYSTESPFPQNFYSGNVVTDGHGKAWVELPDYFHDINVNYKYQLTVVDDSESNQFVQVKVGRKITDGKFMVMTNAPNVTVSWRVEADRNDLYIRAKKPVDVKEKSDRDRGTYQHPELYNKPASLSTFARTKKQKGSVRP